MDYSIPQLPIREENSNKGTFGKILNIAGSEYMPGAAYLSSAAALRVGAGYVKLASCENVLNTVAALAPEVVLSALEDIPEAVETATVICMGCGLTTSSRARAIFNTVIEYKGKIPVVIDADGLNILATMKTSARFWEKIVAGRVVVLTPHPKEAAMLLNCSLEEVLNDLVGSANRISDKYNCITVLKSHETIVTDGEIMYKNRTGTSALAKAGSGDVLAGIIAGFLAQKMSPFEAAILGVYIHGLAGDLAKEDLSEYGVLASDVLKYIPLAIKDYLNKSV